MTDLLDVQFMPLTAPTVGAVAVMAGEELAFGSAARSLDERAKGALTKAARAAGFTGKAKTAIEVLAPGGIDAQRVIVLGTGKPARELDRLLLGGAAFAQISARKGDAGTLIADPADLGEASADAFTADLALGAVLRS